MAKFPDLPAPDVSENVKSLETSQLDALEEAFRDWVQKPKRRDVRFSRKRVFLIFLLIRHAGIKLGEALQLDETKDIDLSGARLHIVKESSSGQRVLPLPEKVLALLRDIIAEDLYPRFQGRLLTMDQAHVRKKFYDIAEQCGMPRELGSPEVVRKSRGIEMLRSGMPLPVVQRALGHSTPALAAEYLSLSDEHVQSTLRHYLTLETQKKTSARNAFFGKVSGIASGDIQSLVTMRSIGGHAVTAVITNSSLKRLGLKMGSFATALIKAPWVLITPEGGPARGREANSYPGTVVGVAQGKLCSEVIVRLSDATELCAVVTEPSRRSLDLRPGQRTWASFNEFSVILDVG